MFSSRTCRPNFSSQLQCLHPATSDQRLNRAVDGADPSLIDERSDVNPGDWPISVFSTCGCDFTSLHRPKNSEARSQNSELIDGAGAIIESNNTSFLMRFSVNN